MVQHEETAIFIILSDSNDEIRQHPMREMELLKGSSSSNDNDGSSSSRPSKNSYNPKQQQQRQQAFETSSSSSRSRVMSILDRMRAGSGSAGSSSTRFVTLLQVPHYHVTNISRIFSAMSEIGFAP